MVCERDNTLLAQVKADSDFMAKRINQRMLDLETLRHRLLSHGGFTPVEFLADIFILQIKLVAETTTWLAVFDQFMRETANPYLALEKADQWVEDHLATEQNTDLWQLSRSGHYWQLISNFYHTIKNGYAFPGIQYQDDQTKVEIAMRFLFDYSLPMVLNQFLLASISADQRADVRQLSAFGEMCAHLGIEEQLPQLLLLDQFQQIMAGFTHLAKQPVSKAKLELSNSPKNWAKDLTQMSTFDLSLWVLAVYEVAGSDWEGPWRLEDNAYRDDQPIIDFSSKHWLDDLLGNERDDDDDDSDLDIEDGDEDDE